MTTKRLFTKLFSLSLLLTTATLFVACGGGSNRRSAETQENTAESVEKIVEPKRFMADEFDKNSTPITIAMPENREKITPHLTENTRIHHIRGVNMLEVTNFSDGVCFVGPVNGRWAIMDTSGNFLTDFIISFSMAYMHRGELPFFYNGVTLLHGAGNGFDGIILINRRGEVVKHFPDLIDHSNFVNGVATGFLRVPDLHVSGGLQRRASIRNVYINTSGEFVFTNLSAERIPEHSRLRPAFGYHDGLAKFYDYHARRYGFINRAGEIIIPAIFREAQDFSEGLAAVMNENELWGFIDTRGNVKIDFIYSNEPTSFSEGFATVRRRGQNLASSLLIDTSGAIRFDGLQQGGTFFNGKAIVYGQRYWYLIDRDMNILRRFPPRHDLNLRRPDFRANGVLYSSNSRLAENFSVVTEFGEVIIEGVQGTFNNGLARFSRPGFRSFINPKGEKVIMFREPEF